MKAPILLLALLFAAACTSPTFSEAPPKDDKGAGNGTGPGGGNVNNCDGYNGSPSCHIIQVPKEQSGTTATAVCPDPYTIIGCGFLCDDGTQSGGTEMIDDKTCRAHCKNSTTAKATAFCYKGDQSHITRVTLNDVPRDTVAYCPNSHPQVLGCTTRCVNPSESNNPGGATLPPSRDGCRARCDWPGDRSPQLTVYCGKYPRPYSQVVLHDVNDRSSATCPSGTTMAGGLGMCVNGRTGGFIASDSRQYIGVCNASLQLDEMAAFCLED
ncbi:MAG: hypothetical protein ABL958_15695 [Bdellovibrionia bacterium]